MRHLQLLDFWLLALVMNLLEVAGDLLPLFRWKVGEFRRIDVVLEDEVEVSTKHLDLLGAQRFRFGHLEEALKPITEGFSFHVVPLQALKRRKPAEAGSQSGCGQSIFMLSIFSTQNRESEPWAKAEMTSNTWSEKPPMFSTEFRSLATCVVEPG